MDWLQSLNKHGYVQVNNFLHHSDAKTLLAKVRKVNKPNAWCLLTHPNRPLHRIKDKSLRSKNVKLSQRQAIQAKVRRQFSYAFWRSSNKYLEVNGMKAIVAQFTQHLTGLVEHALVEGEVSYRDCFVAKFVNNQFIEYHSDGSAGRYAFIYQLSKGWQPKYGGQLQLFPRKIKFYKKSLLPEFNSLALLKLDHPMHHSVKILKTPKHKQRYTISGWIV